MGSQGPGDTAQVPDEQKALSWPENSWALAAWCVPGGARGSQMPTAVKPVFHFGLSLRDTSNFFVGCHLAWIRVTDLWVSLSGNETKMTQGRETAGKRNVNLSPASPYYQL